MSAEVKKINISTQNNTSGLKRPRCGSLDGNEYQVVNSDEPSNLELLPFEVQLRILRMLDLSDLHKMRRHVRSKFLFHLVAHDDVWKPIAIALECPIQNDIPIYGQVHGFLKKLSEKVRRSFERAVGGSEVPTNIVQMLKEPTIAQCFYLQEWLKAKDTLIVWEELAKPNLEGPGINILENADADIEKANEFNAWFVANLNALREIEDLDLGYEQLTSLPDQLGQLELGSLYLNSNQLTSLPTWVGNFTGLDVLNIENNQLTTLPKELGSIPELVELYASNNQITSLPHEIFINSGKMGAFEITGNPLSADALIVYLEVAMRYQGEN